MSKLADVAVEVKKCLLCPLHQNRIKAVPGEGSERAKMFFTGEAPGASEDKEGRPFCGAAGKFLDEMLASINIKRAEVFITNVVKCRPPQNRDPLPLEIKTCQPYLERQLAIIKPKIIVTLGRHSLHNFFPDRLMSQDHGKAVRRKNQLFFFSYHPAVALYNSTMKQTLLSDFQKLSKLIKIA